MEDWIALDSFESFFKEAEPRLNDALSACLGGELGRQAACEALAYGWENWDRVRSMDNPIGDLYVVGRDRGRKAQRQRRVVLPLVEASRVPWVEPALVDALARKLLRRHHAASRNVPAPAGLAALEPRFGWGVTA